MPVTPTGNPLKVAPVAPVVAYVILVIGVLIQTVCDVVAGAEVSVMVLVGFTVTVAVIEGPKQPPASTGVMVNVTITGDAVVLVKVPLIFPVPLAAIPVTATVLSRVQLKDAAVPESTIVVIATPEQTVCDDGVATASPSGVNSSAPISGGLFLV